jgi:hypothetical protein
MAQIDIGLYPFHKIDPPTDAQLETRLRMFRDDLLRLSDWTQLPDSQLSNSKKAEWATYRQALRDLPSTATLGLKVEFPDPPS